MIDFDNLYLSNRILQPGSFAHSFVLNGSDQHAHSPNTVITIRSLPDKKAKDEKKFNVIARIQSYHRPKIIFNSLDVDQVNLIQNTVRNEFLKSEIYLGGGSVKDLIFKLNLFPYQKKNPFEKNLPPIITASSLYIPRNVNRLYNAVDMNGEVFDYLYKDVSSNKNRPAKLPLKEWKQLKQAICERPQNKEIYATSFFAVLVSDYEQETKNVFVENKRDIHSFNEAHNFLQLQKMYRLYMAEPGRMTAIGTYKPEDIREALMMYDKACILPHRNTEQKHLENLLRVGAPPDPAHYLNFPEDLSDYTPDKMLAVLDGKFIEEITLKQNKLDNESNLSSNPLIDFGHELYEDGKLKLRNGNSALGLN